jgi:ferritin
MLKKTVLKALNEQINAELYSAYLYLAMAVWCTDQNLPGFANWLKAQAKEETGHGMRFYKHLEERSAHVELKAIDVPPKDWKSPLAVFQAAYEHEQKVTGMIYDIVNLATREGDHAAAIMCQWFVTEQVEEEAQTLALVEKLKLAGESKGALLYIDKELGKRE